MRTPAAPPYLLPPDHSVSADGWRTPDGGELGERLEHWDPFTDVEAVRAVRVDTNLVRAACQLPADAALALVATWRSDKTRLAGAGQAVELGQLDGVLSAPVSVLVPGASAGGRVDLSTLLLLRGVGTGASAISPRRGGAILWADTDRVMFEGGAARFPLTAVAFSESQRLPDEGLWALDWDSEDLETPVSSAMRLLVNTDSEDLIAAIRSGNADPRAMFLRTFVTYDVARSLVQSALANERFVDGPERFDEGSVGRMLFELIASCWPGVPVENLRRRMIEDPSQLTAQLQSHIGMLT